MIHKFFPFDKNYLMQKAQSDAGNQLLHWMVRKVIATYSFRYNPLGIEDETFRIIKTCPSYNLNALEVFYHEISCIYRFKFNETQLELIFDGRSHYEKYQQEWESAFKFWVEDFCKYSNFLRAVLEGSVILPDNRKASLAQARMKYFLTKYFELKVYRYKGIQAKKLA